MNSNSTWEYFWDPPPNLHLQNSDPLLNLPNSNSNLPQNPQSTKSSPNLQISISDSNPSSNHQSQNPGPLHPPLPFENQANSTPEIPESQPLNLTVPIVSLESRDNLSNLQFRKKIRKGGRPYSRLTLLIHRKIGQEEERIMTLYI